MLEKTEVIDHVSRTKLVTTYSYHHGYYDGREREFRGFGRVDQYDTEEFEAFGQEGLHGEGAAFDNASAAFHVPTVLTRNWFHSGVYFDPDRNIDHRELTEKYKEEYYSGDAGAFDLPGPVFQQADGSRGPDRPAQDAYRALRGALLRSETYALDGARTSEAPGDPYTVAETRYLVRELQAGRVDAHGVFLTATAESLTYHYERNPEDPRIVQELTLEIDRFGNVLKSATIGHGRRAPDPDLSLEDQAKQGETLVTYSEDRYSNAVDAEDDYRVPLPCESRSYHLTGYAPTGEDGRFQPSDFVQTLADGLVPVFDSEIRYEETATTGRQRRLIEHLRTLYRPDDLGSAQDDPLALLPFGQIEPLALPGESYKLAMTPSLARSIYVDSGKLAQAELDGILAEEAGYVQSEGDDSWWLPSGRTFYSRGGDTAAQELAEARQHFFLPLRHRDPFHSDAVGTETLLTYDAYDVLPVESLDALGNRVTATTEDDSGQTDVRVDYRVLQPYWLTDPNGNRTRVAFDALGLVAATAVMGKPGEGQGDRLDGVEADLTQAQTDGFQDAEDPRIPAQALLAGASSRTVYDLKRFWHSRQAHPQDPAQWQPAFAATIARETHGSDLAAGEETKLQIGFSYSDGFGREIQEKVQAEPGPVEGPDDYVDPRWVGSGWTVFNNKGKPVRQYEPFFSRLPEKRHRFEFGAAFGVSPVLFYDPLERVVATLHPNGSYEKAVFDAWRQDSWDGNDTVGPRPRDRRACRRLHGALDRRASGSAGRLGDLVRCARRRRPGPSEQDAAAKALAHGNTPTTAYFDTLGRPS